jgi:tRNA pseudouridine38-40 synthase
MPNWKLTLSYDGSSFHGWQIQPGGLRTIQGTLAAALTGITGETILPQGSGRTDAGVHALAQVASFTLQSPIPAENLQHALNRALPTSIRVLAAEPAPDTFHARHSAVAKTYEYRIFERRMRFDSTEPQAQPPADRICSPFLAPFVWDCRWPLALELLQAATQHILGTHDFTSFAASDPDHSDSAPNPAKTIHSATWRLDAELLIFRITGSGFLHHMVRNLVGTFADVGRASLPRDAIPTILAARDRSAAGPTAPASGLFLAQVHYETENSNLRTDRPNPTDSLRERK